MPLFGGTKKGKYECRVILLDNTEQKHEITNKTLGDELLAEVFGQLNLYEKEYFGLRFKDRNGDSNWLDPNKFVKKQAFYQNPPYTFHFAVKFYAADPTRLREELTRYQFFLQVKKDILQGRIPCADSVAAELCAFAVQSELGDYDPSLHTNDFVSEFRFLPNQTPELESMIAETYPKLIGLQPPEAEMKFLERVKWLDMYGVDLNPVKGQDNMDYLLGLTPTGIVLYKAKNKIGSFIWPKITKLKYKGNCFLLRATQGRNDEEKEYTFICANKDNAKALWKSCAEHHTFFRLEKANDVPASAYNFLFRKNSSFKFRGRTQQEIERDTDRRPRNQPHFQRTPSQRYKRRSSSASDGNRDLYSGTVSPKSNSSTISTPWEASFTNNQPPQSGLYSNGQRNSFPQRPRSANNEYRVESERGVSPKQSRPRSGYSSGGESEKKKRNHYYSGYTSTSDVESVRKNAPKYGSAPNIHHKFLPGMPQPVPGHDFRYDDQPRQRRHHSRESLPNMQHYGVSPHQHHMHHPSNGHAPNGHDPRRYRPSGSKSDGEENSRQHRHHRYHRYQADNEMVAPLDVYTNTMGVALSNEEKHHRHQRRHHHAQNRHHRHHRSTGHIFDPNQAELLLELGPPDTGSGDGVPSDVSSMQSSDKENMHPRPNSGGQYNHPGMKYGQPQMTPPGMSHAPHRFMHQYLPPHLLKQNRPPMAPSSGGGGPPMYKPQYVEQYYYGRPRFDGRLYNEGRVRPMIALPPIRRSQSFNRMKSNSFHHNQQMVVTPSRSGSHKSLKANYNVSTEL